MRPTYRKGKLRTYLSQFQTRGRHTALSLRILKLLSKPYSLFFDRESFGFVPISYTFAGPSETSAFYLSGSQWHKIRVAIAGICLMLFVWFLFVVYLYPTLICTDKTLFFYFILAGRPRTGKDGIKCTGKRNLLRPCATKSKIYCHL